MVDQVKQTYDEVRTLAQDYFGIGDSESETLMKLAKLCAKTAGVPMAGAGAIAMSGVGAVTIPLLGSVPGYVAGALAGFVGGTTMCMIARRSTTEHVKLILGRSGISESRFKSEVKRLISSSQGKSGNYSPKS